MIVTSDLSGTVTMTLSDYEKIMLRHDERDIEASKLLNEAKEMHEALHGEEIKCMIKKTVVEQNYYRYNSITQSERGIPETASRTTSWITKDDFVAAQEKIIKSQETKIENIKTYSVKQFKDWKIYNIES